MQDLSTTLTVVTKSFSTMSSPVQTSEFSLTSSLMSSLTRMYDEQVFLDKFSLTGFVCSCVREI